MLTEIKMGCGTSYNLNDIENEGISFIPYWKNPEGEESPMYTFSHLWGERQQITRETFRKKSRWEKRTPIGIQIFTGKPTFRKVEHTKTGYIHLVDIDIEHITINKHQETLQKIISTYTKGCDREPCIIITKRGGIRLSCFSDFCGTKIAWRDTKKQMLIEFCSHHSMSKIDERYSQNKGSILNIPEVPKKTLQEIYKIAETIGSQVQVQNKPVRVANCQIQDFDIQWHERHHKDKVYNVSQLFPSEFCQETKHSSNRNEVRFTAYTNGSVSGFCFNCGGTWWEIPPKEPKNIPPQPQKYRNYSYRRYKRRV